MTEEIPPIENTEEKPPKEERKPILEQLGEMNVSGLISFFKDNKNVIFKTLGEKMENELKHSEEGITPQTFRTAIRRITTHVPGPAETEKLLEKIKNNK